MQDKNNHNIDKIIKIEVASWINKIVELRINDNIYDYISYEIKIFYMRVSELNVDHIIKHEWSKFNPLNFI